jgi:hypothetical protein
MTKSAMLVVVSVMHATPSALSGDALVGGVKGMGGMQEEEVVGNARNACMILPDVSTTGSILT